MGSTVIQVGHSRDGGRYFHAGAGHRGASVSLIETASGRSAFDWGQSLGEPAFADVRWAAAALDEVIAAGAAVAREHDVLAVVPGFELFTVAAQQLGERLGFQGTVPAEVMERLRRKDLQRSWLRDRLDADTQPRFEVCRSEVHATAAALAIGFPVVVKPVDSGGSSGVRLVHDRSELLEAVRPILLGQSLDDGTDSERAVLLEEFIDGPEHGVQGVVDVGGDVRVVSVSSKALRTEGGAFLERRHILEPPCNHIDVAEFAADVVTGLGLRGSAFHADIRLRHGDPVLVEAGARLSGAYIPRALSLAGVDWGASALAVGLGAPARDAPALDAYVAIELLTPEMLPAVLRVHRHVAPMELILDLRRLQPQGAYADFHDRVGARVIVGATILDVRAGLEDW